MKGNGGFPFVGFTEEDKERLQIVISDVDDTITKNGKLYPDVLEAMWRIKASGRTIVLVTGGSVGWSDAYLRQWPVDAVIAESGAVMICHGKDEDVVQIVNPVINKEEVFSKRRLLLEKTEGLPLSSDQCARVFDIAYDKKKMNEYENVIKIKERKIKELESKRWCRGPRKNENRVCHGPRKMRIECPVDNSVSHE